MIDLRTGKEMTRRDFGKGIAAIVSAGIAPSIAMGIAESANATVGRGMMRNVGARNTAISCSSKINFLESSGLEWIDTGINSSDDLEFEIKLDNSVNNRYDKVGYFGNIGSWGNYFGAYSNEKKCYWVRPSMFYWNNYNGLIIAECKLYNLFINGMPAISHRDSGNEYKGNITLFNGYNGTTKIRVYYFKIFKGNDLIRNFLPVVEKIDGDYVGFMKDGVSGDLFGNVSGQGEFTWG